MDEKFKRIENKLDQVAEKLSDIDKTVAVYNEQLKIHIEGTIQNREALKNFQTKVDTDFRPVNRHINMIEGALKFILLVSLFVGIAAGLSKIAGN